MQCIQVNKQQALNQTMENIKSQSLRQSLSSKSDIKSIIRSTKVELKETSVTKNKHEKSS